MAYLQNYEGLLKIRLIGHGYSSEDFFGAIMAKLEQSEMTKDCTIAQEMDEEDNATLIIGVRSVALSVEEKD